MFGFYIFHRAESLLVGETEGAAAPPGKTLIMVLRLVLIFPGLTIGGLLAPFSQRLCHFAKLFDSSALGVPIHTED